MRPLWGSVTMMPPSLFLRPENLWEGGEATKCVQLRGGEGDKTVPVIDSPMILNDFPMILASPSPPPLFLLSPEIYGGDWDFVPTVGWEL